MNASASGHQVVITGITKIGGPLTKRITLAPDGSLRSDGSACVMARGTARRLRFENLETFANHIGALGSHEAIALGALLPDLPDQVRIVTKHWLAHTSRTPQPDIIARTGDHITYAQGQPGVVLLDFDTKGMPPAIASHLKELGGFWCALESVLPDLTHVGRITRRSTSAGLFRADTRERLLGSDGQHVFVAVQNVADAGRFLSALHSRCWLKGFGWMMVGGGGQLLERSIVDRMVGAPERLVFEGAPILDPPLMQDTESRRPVVVNGVVLDSAAACQGLTILERSRLRELWAHERERLAPESIKAQAAFISDRAKRLAHLKGLTREKAMHVVTRQCAGILLSDVVLPFDDEELAGATVADVLANPVRFDGATLADPLEGVEYGPCKAKIMRRADGSVWINSLAHGRTTYDLKFDLRAALGVLKQRAGADVPNAFIHLALSADLNDTELEELRHLAHELSGVGNRALGIMLKHARAEQTAREAEAKRERRMAARQDARPYLPAPLIDAERIPIVSSIDDVLCNQPQPEPPVRDAEGRPTEARYRIPIMLHELLNTNTNTGEPDEADPPPSPGDAVADTT